MSARNYVFCIFIHHPITQITEKNNSPEYIRNFVLCSTREILKETLAADEEYHRDKWTLFGNEAEKVEIDVIRNQHILRTRVDKLALRNQVNVNFWSQEWLVKNIALYLGLRTQLYQISVIYS